MSDPFDDRLALALKSAVPDLPGAFDPQDIIRAPHRRSPYRWVAPLAVVMLVLGIAAGVVALHGGHRQGSHAGVGQQANQLYGAWILTDVRGMNGTRHTQPEYRAVFAFAADGTVHGACVATRSTFDARTIAFRHGWPDLLVADGCRRLSAAQDSFVFGRVLHGTAPWQVSRGVLTIGTKSASIVLTRPEDLDNGDVPVRLYQLALDAALDEGVQIDQAAAAFAENAGGAESVVQLVRSPYAGPQWVLRVRTVKPFACGECHGQVVGRPERFKYLYLFADLEAHQFAKAGIGGRAAQFAKLDNVIRLRPSASTSGENDCRFTVGLNGSTYDLSQTSDEITTLEARAPALVRAKASKSCKPGGWALSTDRESVDSSSSPPGLWYIDRPGLLRLTYVVSSCPIPPGGCVGGVDELRHVDIKITS